MTDHIYARMKRRATKLGTSFAKFARCLVKSELDAPASQGDIDSVCGMVTGTPIDIARDGMPVNDKVDYPYCG